MKRLIVTFCLAGALLCAAGATADSFDGAIKAYRAGDYATAFEGFLDWARRGDHVAQHNVAVMYHRGEGVERDPARAYAWMTLAVQGDDEDILRAHHALMILSPPGAISQGRETARRLAGEYGLRMDPDAPVRGLRVVSGR